MISERSFARSFSGFWTELLPLLTPTFVHMVEEGYKEPLTDRFGARISAVPKSPETRDAAVVAEFAFFLVQTALSEEMTVDVCFSKESLRARAETAACEVVARYEASRHRFEGGLNAAELQEGLALSRNYECFLSGRCTSEDVEFSPSVRGAGFIAACQGDLSIGRTLFEVKTVERNLASKDIRQLIVYLALQHATGQRRWDHAGFMNPRRALSYEFGVDELVNRMSGGRSAPEVFRDLVDFACTRDLHLDRPF